MERKDLWWIAAAIAVLVAFIANRTKNRPAGALPHTPPRRATSRLAAVTFAEKIHGTEDLVAHASTTLTDSRYWWTGSMDAWPLAATQAELKQVGALPGQRDAMVVVVFDVSGLGLTPPSSRPEAAQLLRNRGGDLGVVVAARYICEDSGKLESAGFRR